MKSLDIYKQADKTAEYLLKQYARQFSRYSSSAKFDELNVIKRSKELYGWLDKVTREAYLILANIVYGYHAEDDDDLAEAWLSGVLDDYDPVTRYVYTNEWERKRQRYAEGMIAGKDKRKESDTALHLLARQAVQYSITVADEAQLEAFRRNGVRRVRWVAEDDARTCDVCHMRDRTVYDIGRIPPKPHYNCRCRLEPVMEG